MGTRVAGSSCDWRDPRAAHLRPTLEWRSSARSSADGPRTRETPEPGRFLCPHQGVQLPRVMLGVAGLLLAGGLSAQTPAPKPAPPTPLAVGTQAPDFALPGATRYGLMAQPVHLSDFKGKTVVLAFFYEARTKG